MALARVAGGPRDRRDDVRRQHRVDHYRIRAQQRVPTGDALAAQFWTDGADVRTLDGAPRARADASVPIEAPGDARRPSHGAARDLPARRRVDPGTAGIRPSPVGIAITRAEFGSTRDGRDARGPRFWTQRNP